MTRRPFTEFLYRLLLVAYPSDFRRMLGGEAAGAFGQLHRDEWREGGIKAVAGLWRRSVLQVIGYGLKERWEKRQRSSRTNAGRRNDLIRMVVGKGLLLTTIGVAIGLAGAVAVSRALESLVFGVSTTDPLTFVVVSLLLAAVAIAACYLPARKAAAADPLVALRAE